MPRSANVCPRNRVRYIVTHKLAPAQHVRKSWQPTAVGQVSTQDADGIREQPRYPKLAKGVSVNEQLHSVPTRHRRTEADLFRSRLRP